MPPTRLKPQATTIQRNRRRRRTILFICILIGRQEWSKQIKQPYNNAPFSGSDYVHHILNGNRLRAQAMFRLLVNVFHVLASIDEDPVSKLNMDEQLAIFLYIVGQKATNGQTQDRFQHSRETILQVFHHLISFFPASPE